MSLVIYVVGAVQIARGTGNRDVIAYWATGRLLSEGRDPYDAASVLELEQSAGWNADGVEIMRNPPVAFFLIAPLGLMSLRVGTIIWTIALLACLLLSVRQLASMLGRPNSKAQYFCLCLAPVLTCLTAGQFGIFMLFGVSLFLYLQERQPLFAGAALVFCALKPHLFLPFAVVLLLWILYKCRFRVLAGIILGVLITSVIALLLDPNAFSHYSKMMATAQPTEHPFVPTLSKFFRLLLNPASVWLQFVPAIIGCAWSAWYFVRHRDHWEWTHHGMLVLIISVGCAPYAWFTDESLLAAPVLAGLYRGHSSGRSILPLALINFVLIAEIFKGYWITTPYFVWSVPAWLAWYLYASSHRRPMTTSSPATVPG
jgi:hypothetical protein